MSAATSAALSGTIDRQGMDANLVIRAQRGDQGAFANIASAIGPRFHGVAYGILRDRELAEEVTQQAIVDCWRSLPQLRDPSRFDGWAYRLVVNACYSEARRAKRSFELHPPIRRDKCTVVVELAQGLDSVAYVGDDVGDLPAFDGLDQLAERGVTTLRVAVTSEEAPPILLRRADRVVDGPAGAEDLLRRLLDLIS